MNPSKTVSKVSRNPSLRWWAAGALAATALAVATGAQAQAPAPARKPGATTASPPAVKPGQTTTPVGGAVKPGATTASPPAGKPGATTASPPAAKPGQAAVPAPGTAPATGSPSATAPAPGTPGAPAAGAPTGDYDKESDSYALIPTGITPLKDPSVEVNPALISCGENQNCCIMAVKQTHTYEYRNEAGEGVRKRFYNKMLRCSPTAAAGCQGAKNCCPSADECANQMLTEMKKAVEGCAPADAPGVKKCQCAYDTCYGSGEGSWDESAMAGQCRSMVSDICSKDGISADLEKAQLACADGVRAPGNWFNALVAAPGKGKFDGLKLAELPEAKDCVKGCATQYGCRFKVEDALKASQDKARAALVAAITGKTGSRGIAGCAQEAEASYQDCRKICEDNFKDAALGELRTACVEYLNARKPDPTAPALPASPHARPPRPDQNRFIPPARWVQAPKAVAKPVASSSASR